jgi:hypothetical protein
MAIVDKNDRKIIFLMFLKLYHHLHPLSKVERFFVDKMTKITIWIIFEMIANINELANKLIN